jgi:hypothetical protein
VAEQVGAGSDQFLFKQGIAFGICGGFDEVKRLEVLSDLVGQVRSIEGRS